MTTEQILEIYPGPWKVETKIKKDRAWVILTDYNGNDIAEIYGEKVSEAQALATLLCKLPDAVTLSTI